MNMQALEQAQVVIPRPEFPRPDWQRADWLNLNGMWSFKFDPNNEGLVQSWQDADQGTFESEITVPFSWASPLSGIGQDQQGIGWYRRALNWTPSATHSRLFLRFGAVDYTCDVWINGKHVGSHQGGYGTFEFEVTNLWQTESANVIVVRVEDDDHNFQARGKQGYGEIRGIWQPVWLEARPEAYIRDAKFITSIDGRIQVTTRVVAEQAGQATLSFHFAEGAVQHEVTLTLKEGENQLKTSFIVADPKLWSPETPHLYEGELRLVWESAEVGDVVKTYFGIREISTALVGERKYRWVTLNGKPIYLNGTLDQSYHPTGYFTYPSDEEMHDEIYLMKRLGLNFVRIHIKPEEPRKLYWADKLGILVMEDMPCFWGNPDDQARSSYESEALETIERDYNHPSIFSWVMFNETWGLKTDSKAAALTGDQAHPNNYLPATQDWVRATYHWAKQLDPTRIVEDNSPCNHDHVESDINTWHFYLNGYEIVRDHLAHVTQQTYPGSTFNYIGSNVQGDAPLMNSECGNVWGIEGGAGDSDLAWHYHYMMNEMRKHDKLCGFVFTEFRDVTNEFNGYYRLDGSDKQFGYEDFVPDMTIADLHSADFIVIDAAPCQTVDAGAEVVVPLLRSSYSDRYHGQALRVVWQLWYDDLGTRTVADCGSFSLEWDGYGVTPLESIGLRMPAQDAVAVLAVSLVDAADRVITRNFTTFDVRSDKENGDYNTGTENRFVRAKVESFSEQSFPYVWEAIEGSKVNGTGTGHFTYTITLPDQAAQAVISDVAILFEASAKRVLARNVEGAKVLDAGIDMMHGASADVEYNSNTYYMTDDDKHTSLIHVLVDGEKVGSFFLPDDPADSRGVLSWHYQPIVNKLDEAGSYGYLCKASIPGRLAAKLDRNRSFQLELQAENGGLALY
ncbi:MAG: beta galactosidase jelly roll domain-containing protein, partial [Gorillibacterium sp.]|nr:beta galactosidase jelly roll domain-containing protein [Gorillibacterium sp.]